MPVPKTYSGGDLTPGTELFGFGKKRPTNEPKFHDRHTLMEATNHATECANDTVDAVHSVMSNLPKTADEWKARTHALDKIQSKIDSMDIRTKDPDKEFSQTGWSGADAARNLKSVQTTFDSINKNDNWVRDVIEELPKHIHDEHVLAAAKHFFHAASGIYMDVLGTLYIALRELKRAADPARALVG